MSPSSQIVVGCNEKVVCVRVRGRGTFLNSAGIKQFANEMINRGHREFVIDLLECPVMDSTFMGTLTSMALRLRKLGQGAVRVIHLNERNGDLLRGLGLDQILELESGSHDFAQEPGGMNGMEARDAELSPADAKNKQLTAETMLAAHQALVDADPENLSRFKDVLEYLKQDLQPGRTSD